MIRYSPKAFLAGMLVGVIALGIVGSVSQPKDLIQNFRRFSFGFNSRWFLATARELHGILETASRDKIVVVVGGTSVMQGATQAARMVWTDALKRALGDRYVVINMAQRSGASNDTGNVVAEMALKEHRQVIYLCDSMVDRFGWFPNESRFQPIVFDAWRRGYLLNWAPRNAAMRYGIVSSSPSYREAAWGSLLDRLLNFKDLWNFVSFEWWGTTWNSIDRDASYRPLRTVEDPEPTPEFIKAYLPHLRMVTETDMHILRKIIISPDNEHWKQVVTSTETDFPPELRAVAVVLVNLNNPDFLDQLTPDERNRFMIQAHFMSELLRQLGFEKVLIPELGFDSEDFNDRVHLSVQGGEKLAVIVAPQVEAKARELGYIK